MPIVRTFAFVLRAHDYGDSSRIFRVYTASAGVQALLARGVKQARSRFRGVLDLFNLVELSYYKKAGRSLHLPREADLLESYPGMKRDLDRTLAFAGVARLLGQLSLEDEGQPDLFEFLTATATAFDGPELTAQGVEPLRHYACWQILARRGYAPEIDRCVTCGARAGGTPAFAIAEGGIVCAHCGVGRRRLSRGEYGALQLFLHGDGQLASGWRLSSDEGRRLDRIREEFAIYHAGLPERSSKIGLGLGPMTGGRDKPRGEVDGEIPR